MNQDVEPRDLCCPYCRIPMRPVKAACPRCGVGVEKAFRLPRVALLPPDDVAFLAEYVLAGFSIKDLEDRVGLSYPAIRARLDRIIKNMRALSAGVRQRQVIIDRVERGELKPDEAIRLIEALK